MSLGQDTGDVAFQVREEDNSERRTVPYRRTRDHHARARPDRSSVLDHERRRRPKGRTGTRRQKVDL